jgi:fumarate reductase flavoprotein subunit
MPDVDIVIVGGGGAGLAAAVTAADEGASVLVVEAADEVGGATALAGGSFMAAGTAQQAALGHTADSAEEFYDYYMTFNRWDADPAVVRRFCDRAAPTLRWLEGLGVEFLPENLYRAGLERAPRSHRPTGGGLAIVQALKAACAARDIEIALGNRVDGLIVEDGRVRGVRARGEDLTAAATIITTGGFGANPEMIAAHYPDALRGGGDVWSPAPGTCAGDGIVLGRGAGAGCTGRNHGELLLTPGFNRDLEPFVPGWLMYVTEEGRRFVSETAPHTVVTPLALTHGDTCWVVLDDAACRSAAAPADARWGAGSWVADTLLAEAGRGRVVTAPTIDDLAARTGMDPVVLAGTVARYNADCKAGTDSRFAKDPAVMKPVATPPFYAVRMRPSVVAVTGYGLRTDADARVLREADGEPVPGLYAAGEVSGSVLGAQYVGGGNAVGSALIFGRVAAQSATAER